MSAPATKDRLNSAVPGSPWRPRRWLTVLALTLAFGGGLYWRQHQGAATAVDSSVRNRTNFAGRGQPVTVAGVEQRDIRVLVNAIGTITASNTAVVHTRVDGELKKIFFKEGQPVRAGQLLAQIDPQPFQIAVSQAHGTLTRDQALLNNAQIDLQRYRDLVAKDAAPKQQADTQEALVQQLQGTVLSDQASLDNAKLQLSYTRVLAPLSGLAGLKQADLGNVVHAADTNSLLSIAQVQPASMVFAVPDTWLPRIRQQLKAHKPLTVEAWDRDQKTLLASGQVASTDNAIDTSTGTIRLKAQFANTDVALFPNQFVNIRLRLDTLAGALAVPSAALQRGASGSYVYVATTDGTVNLRKVQVSATDGDWVAVQGELKPGENVVTDGADRLRDGAKVEIIIPGKMASGTAKGTKADRGSASSPNASGASSATSERGAWRDRVPPEVAGKLKSMSPEERKAWFQKQREQRGNAN